MSKYRNLSDGESDGIVLFYLKGGKLKTVLLTQSLADSLDLCLGLGTGKEKLRIVDVDRNEMIKML